jgi:hypothetical protein
MSDVFFHAFCQMLLPFKAYKYLIILIIEAALLFAPNMLVK